MAVVVSYVLLAHAVNHLYTELHIKPHVLHLLAHPRASASRLAALHNFCQAEHGLLRRCIVLFEFLSYVGQRKPDMLTGLSLGWRHRWNRTRTGLLLGAGRLLPPARIGRREEVQKKPTFAVREHPCIRFSVQLTYNARMIQSHLSELANPSDYGALQLPLHPRSTKQRVSHV